MSYLKIKVLTINNMLTNDIISFEHWVQMMCSNTNGRVAGLGTANECRAVINLELYYSFTCNLILLYTVCSDICLNIYDKYSPSTNMV